VPARLWGTPGLCRIVDRRRPGSSLVRARASISAIFSCRDAGDSSSLSESEALSGSDYCRCRGAKNWATRRGVLISTAKAISRWISEKLMAVGFEVASME
jgi:hypothetical protein